MASDPVDGNVQIPAPNKKSDDFDMAKLQKQLRHEQRRSASSKYKAAKLSPAEIRSLNYDDYAIKAGTSRTNHRRSAKAISSNTPPQTPENNSTRHDGQQRRRPTAAPELLPPPVSPPHERRGSNASNRVIYAPQPLSHHQLPSFTTVPTVSRPPSQTSYRGIATYRGPEITRSGSFTMLQRPSPDIVSNPLSNFSRPRQSTITSSPEKTNVSRRPSEDSMLNSMPLPTRAQTVDVPGGAAPRQPSPFRNSDSSVPMDENRPSQKAVVSSAPNDDAPVVHTTPKALPPIPADDATEPSAKQKLNWRKTLTSSSTNEAEMAPLRKEYKRRTFVLPKAGQCLHAVNYADTKPGQPPLLRDTLKDELPSIKTSVFKGDDNGRTSISSEFNSHPAVRPLSQDGEQASDIIPDSSTSSSKKGKEREVEADSITSTDVNSLDSTYTKCDCCGRIVKPGGYASDLSPVLESDNVRSNLNSEVERPQPERRGRSSSYGTSNSRYVASSLSGGDSYQQVRPTEIGRQYGPSTIPAVIGPAGLVGVAINKPGDVIGPSSMPLAIMPPSKAAPRFTRFGSLHARKETPQEGNDKAVKDDAADRPNAPGIQRFGSLHGLRDQYKDAQSQAQVEPQSQAHLPQQSSPPTPSQMQNISAYQAQQLKRNQYDSPQSQSSYHSATSSHQSMMTSRSKLSQEIYHDSEESTPIPSSAQTHVQDVTDSGTEETIIPDQGATQAPAQLPAQVSPPEHPFDMPETDEDDMMVDLSSFDGHFVHRSLARSATMMQATSPPATSHGLPQQEQPQPKSPPRPYRIDTSVASTTSADTASEYTPASIPSSTPPHAYSAAHHAVTNAPTVITTEEKSDLEATQGQQKTGEPTSRPRPTTIVRLIPSPVIGSASSSPISTTRDGQLKLGDWVLPESPRTATHSLNGSHTNLAQGAGATATPSAVNGRIGVAA